MFVNGLDDEEAEPVPTTDRPGEEDLASYVGTYFHDATMSECVVTQHSGKLSIQRSKGPARELRAVSKTNFMEDVAGHEVAFDPEAGTVFYNRKALGTRLDRAQPTQDQLKELVGTYWSPELLVSFDLVLGNQGWLRAVHPRFDQRSALQPITADRFRLLGTYAGFDVIPDPDQHVIGLAFQSGRVWDLGYERLGPRGADRSLPGN